MRWIGLLTAACLLGCESHERELAARGAPTADDAGTASDAASGSDVTISTAVVSGLELLNEVELPWDPSGSPHGSRLLTDATTRAWIVDSNLMLAAQRPALSMDIQSEPTQFLRCPVATLGGGNLYCGSPDTPVLVVFDAVTGKRRWPAAPLVPTVERGTFDLVWAKGALYSAAVGEGVERIDLDAASLPIEHTRRIWLRGDIEALDGDGDTRLAAFDATTSEVVLLQGHQIAHRVKTDGPAVRLQLDGAHVLASMGSQGVAVIDWATGAITHRVRPPAVADSAALSDGVLAIGTHTGLYVYDLARSSEVPVGFTPAMYGYLDVRFLDGALAALDWRRLRRFAVHREGHVTSLDFSKGYVLPDGFGLRVPLRNESDLSLELAGVRVPPRSVGWLDFPPKKGDEERRFGEQRFKLVRRNDRARLGAPLPVRTPSALAGRRVTFAQTDCALQFPEWKDIRWLQAHPAPAAPEPTLILVMYNEGYASAWTDIWHMPETKPMSAYVDGRGLDRFNELFGLTLFFGGGDNEANYTLDDSAAVVELGQEYRSIHALPAPVLIPPPG